MKPLPRISIVTPSYNQAKFLQQTLDSVCAQNDPNYEHIIMDGASNDGSVDILAKYTGTIQFESKKDKGQTDAINKGIKKSQGEIFAYINSDDYYLSGAFKIVREFFAANPGTMWLVGDSSIVDENGRLIQAFVRFYKKILRTFYQPWMLFILNPFPQPSVFIRKEAIEKVGIFDSTLFYTMDYEYWLRLQKKFGAPSFIATPPLSAFRIHGQSKGGSQYKKQFTEELFVAMRYTKNGILLTLHRLHTACILAAYTVLK